MECDLIKRYLIIISYDGSAFHGYQRQKKLRTVQGVLEKALTFINDNSKVEVHAAGRTDALVHALRQYVHFDLKIKISPSSLKKALNSRLPRDIFVLDIREVNPDFHTRYNIISKEYIYKINVGEYNPLERNYIYQYNKPLDTVLMNDALKYLIGTHDFKAFAATSDLKENTIRTIYQITIEESCNILTFKFVGDGFLKYQIRNMMGVLIDIGCQKRKVDDIPSIIDSKSRLKASKTANPEGLYLSNCIYEGDF